MIFKGLSMKETTQFFLEGESPTLMISFHCISAFYFWKLGIIRKSYKASYKHSGNFHAKDT